MMRTIFQTISRLKLQEVKGEEGKFEHDMYFKQSHTHHILLTISKQCHSSLEFQFLEYKHDMSIKRKPKGKMKQNVKDKCDGERGKWLEKVKNWCERHFVDLQVLIFTLINELSPDIVFLSFIFSLEGTENFSNIHHALLNGVALKNLTWNCHASLKNRPTLTLGIMTVLPIL
jgi:hypothetical protein